MNSNSFATVRLMEIRTYIRAKDIQNWTFSLHCRLFDISSISVTIAIDL